ncbi:MAG TPA: PilZ domain-containing protein [Myxococcota bacterium]|nr:PilZ domain-containing protein [Myxococcota bacterium]HQK50302.1 PilZ domain-containing protein [Myxococcota bacterium]
MASPSSPSSPSSGAAVNETYIGSLFDCIRALRKAEQEATTPYGRGDPILATRIKELRTYRDVLLKQAATQKPRMTLTEKKNEEASYDMALVFPSGLLFYEALDLSLSKGGLFVKTDQILPIDTVVDLKCTIEEEQIEFRIQGKVVWINPRETAGRPAGMGLKFPRITNMQRQMLLDFLSGEIPLAALAHMGD